jgi:AcrR family transcriptional regulator
VLDAAERVMATEGFEAATIARVVDEASELSSVYHYYGSKDGVLLAVMQRGAERFHADLTDYDQQSGTAVEHLRLVIIDALERHPNFLRRVPNPKVMRAHQRARAVTSAFAPHVSRLQLVVTKLSPRPVTRW